MAVKNYEADVRIREAAMQEFLACGYRDASLRRIAEKAGTTTGSLYMRYRSKDDLFAALTSVVIRETEKAFDDLAPVYAGADTPEGLTAAIRTEAQTILSILFGHYEEATLLLCRSEGSSAGTFFDRLAERKIRVSDAYFGGFADAPDFRHAFEVLLTVQLDMYRQILQNGYTREEAGACLEILMKFVISGWNGLSGELANARHGHSTQTLGQEQS